MLPALVCAVARGSAIPGLELRLRWQQWSVSITLPAIRRSGHNLAEDSRRASLGSRAWAIEITSEVLDTVLSVDHSRNRKLGRLTPG